MPSFFYTARDHNGTLQSGHLEAVDEDEVLSVLQNRGLIVTALSRKESRALPSGKPLSSRRLHGRATSDDKVLFCEQLATLLDAGIPLTKSLQVISAQVESRLLLKAVDQMRQDIEAGRTFHDALAKHPKIFSSFWANIVETGEASGHLAQSLKQLAGYLESSRHLQQQAVTAMTYPLVLMVASASALTFFMLKIIPIFSNIFKNMHVQLPLLTQIVIGLSYLTQHYFLVIVGALVGLGWVSGKLIRTEQGRWVADHAVLKIPVVNMLLVNLQLAQFSRGVATLLESGVPILFTLEIMERTASNKVYGKAIGEVKGFVREGKTMAEPLERSGLFPAMIVQMVQVGEEIGELGKMMDRVAKYYEGRVEMFIERMTSLFEPIAIAVMAAVIGVLVIAMFLPIFSLAGGANIH
ncbi:MAG: type II secretion system F family protein [Candidatus Omnitrophica bacterium]|nr:type II secretion system F family protein [Candidatus Omnitrophota bacterium]